MDLHIEGRWTIPEAYLELRATRSSGPGGQNVNKVSTKVELRFRLDACPVLSDAQRERLRSAHPTAVTREGELVLTSDRTRSQLQNQQDVFARLREWLLAARFAPKRRVPTKVSKGAKRRRVEDKRHRANVKQQRSGRFE